MTRLASGGLTLCIAVVVTSICESAQASDPATATMLFNEARRLVAAGRYPEACPKFEESQRLDPGIGTQFNLADCYVHTQRTAAAWALFLDVASSAGGTGQEAREAVARKRAAALEPHLSKLTLVPPKNVPGLEVRRNGEELGALLWNSPIPVDPGTYTIEASAPSRKKWSSSIAVGPNGASVTVTIPDLAPGDVPPPATISRPNEPHGGGTTSPSPLPSTQAIGDHGPQLTKVLALAFGGVGVVGVGVGAFFGLKSISKHSDYEGLCRSTGCSPSAGPIHDDAVTAGNVSTVAFVVGGAFLAGGVVLWAIDPKRSPASGLYVTPTVTASSAGVAVQGGW